MKIFKFILMFLCFVSCQPTTAPKNTVLQNSAGGKNNNANSATNPNSGSNAFSNGSGVSTSAQTNYVVGNMFGTSTAVNDASINAAAQRNQNFITNINTKVPGTNGLMRFDAFYKCRNHLSHTYYTINTNQGADNSGTALANQVIKNLYRITNDVKTARIGAYDAYSVAKDKSGTLYLFYTSDANQDVYYTWYDSLKSGWVVPRSLTNISHFQGIPTAMFDKTQSAIVVEILSIAPVGMHTFTQTGVGTFAKTPNPPNVIAPIQVAFDQLQNANGQIMEGQYSTSENSIVPAVVVTSIASRLISDLLTVGVAEIATAVHKDAQNQAEIVLGNIEAQVCK